MTDKKKTDKRKGNSNGTSALKKIQELARGYRKDHPGCKWTECIQHGSKIYNAEKKK
jgi:hypothetical protein